VAELAAGVALHGLSLAVASEVVGTAALVAGGGARITLESTAEALETTTGTGGTASTGGGGVGAVAGKVTGLVAVVAAAIGTTVQAKGGAVSLDVTDALTIVALLGLGSTGPRAAARLVARLLAVVAETLRGRADLSIVANVATLVARTTRQHHLR
jgi:hypothetical protein